MLENVVYLFSSFLLMNCSSAHEQILAATLERLYRTFADVFLTAWQIYIFLDKSVSIDQEKLQSLWTPFYGGA